MNPLDFIILSLATFRLSSLLVNETGPWWIFVKIRKIAGIQHDQTGDIMSWDDKFFAEVLVCVWCTSVWVATGLMILWHYFPIPTIFISTIFAFSTVAILANKYASE